MKYWLTMVMAAVVSCAGPAGTESDRDIGAAEARQKIGAGEATVVDVRTPGEYQSEHIAGAVVVPYNSANLASEVRTAAAGKPVILYCRTGRRSAVALDKLDAAGVGGVQHLEGGITAWKAAGGAVVR